MCICLRSKKEKDYLLYKCSRCGNYFTIDKLRIHYRFFHGVY